MIPQLAGRSGMNHSTEDRARRIRRLPLGVWILGGITLALGLARLWLGPAGDVERSASVLASWRELLLISATVASTLTFAGALPIYLFSRSAERAQAAGELVKGLLSFFAGVLAAVLAQ
jgi:hypothetical protein